MWKKVMLCVVVAAMVGSLVQAADVIYRAAPLSTPVTNVVTYSVGPGRVAEPLLFVSKTGVATNTPVLSVVPADGSAEYTVYTRATQTNGQAVVVSLNNILPTAPATNTAASPRIILLAGDKLKITGTAAASSWTNSSYYLQVRETVQ